MPLEIVTIPCLSDNYAFLLHNASTGATALIDAPEAPPILSALKARGWQLSDILLTHHHYDHIDGVADLVAATGARVWGNPADASRLPALDHALDPGARVSICDERAQVFDMPGHTIGHIALYFPDTGAAFTADSLMALGCGRLFEGTPEQMHTSLAQIAALPPETLICSGHEYTASNANFAATIEPENTALILRSKAIAAARSAGEATVPSTLAEELATNPFLRSHSPEIRAQLGMEGASDTEVFTEIRARKDRF